VGVGGRGVAVSRRNKKPSRSIHSPPLTIPKTHTPPQQQLAEAHAVVDDNDSTWSLGGLAVFLAFLAAAGAYLYVRVTELISTGRASSPWPLTVLIAEILGASSVGLYALCLARRQPASVTAAARAGNAPVPAGTHVHVLVPCYTEALTIVAETVWAAAEADLPPGATSTVWLLDDGADPAKKEWVAGLACPRIRYVAGRSRAPGEVNGKAGNLNAALASIYPPGGPPPPVHDAVAVFDADQVCDRTFFAKTLPLLFEEEAAAGKKKGGPADAKATSTRGVGLVLTPQRYANVDERADIFNHSNRHFWEAMIPGLTAWGMVVCTGTNLVLKSTALTGVGGFPADTVTEDYLLGMELKAAGWEARYVVEYLATGEAPEDGSLFRQRSRWCKGHLQALFSRSHCPLLQPRLSLLQRVLYSSGAWAYITSALTTPLLAAVPVVALLGSDGAPASHHLPFALTPRLATAFLPYFLAVHAVVYWCDAPDLLRALWFGGIAARLLWWTYAKALWNTGLWALGLKRASRFKSTAKAGLGPAPSGRLATAGSAGNGAAALSPAGSAAAPVPAAAAATPTPTSPPSVASWRDIWAPLLLATASAAAAVVGCARIASGEEDAAALDVLTAWAAYNALPPLLLAHYAWVGRGASLRAACGAAATLSTAVLAGAAFAGWLFLPPHIRGDAFGLGDRYTGGGRGGLFAPAGPKAAFYADAILSALGAEDALGGGGGVGIGAPVAAPAGGLRTSLGGR
jgi:endoglucanase